MRNIIQEIYMTWFLVLNLFIPRLNGHGYLMDPPGRASMWRFGYDTPIDYNDNQLFCGGFAVQHFQNGGKCGVCGDEYGKDQLQQPPGPFARGIISRTYTMNSNVTMWFKITASHRGFLEFRVCPNNDVTKPATQECLDQYLLADTHTGGTKFYFNYATVGTYGANIVLPQGLTCSQCVLQWRYKTGNSWGCINDDPSVPENCGIGEGRQEEFYSCADIAIVSSNGDNSQQTTSTTTATTKQSTFPVTITPQATTSLSSTTNVVTTTIQTTPAVNPCFAVGVFQLNPGMDTWCKLNCLLGNCPESICSPSCIQSFASTRTSTKPTSPQSTPVATTVSPKSSTISTYTKQPAMLSTTEAPPVVTVTCFGAGAWQNDPGMSAWCTRNCNLGHCPVSHCQCTKDGALSEGLGAQCKTVMTNITQSYRVYMDKWCEHNCPLWSPAGCVTIPHICKCT